KVPVDVAATGPRVIEVGARLAESVTFAVGADPERLAWAADYARQARKQAGLDPSTLKLGAFLNVVVHPDFARARAMARGTVGTIAHFSGMSRDSSAGMRPDDRAVVQKVGQTYDMSRHARGDAGHAQFIDDAFVDRFAIAGPPAHCVKLLRGAAQTRSRSFGHRWPRRRRGTHRPNASPRIVQVGGLRLASGFLRTHRRRAHPVVRRDDSYSGTGQGHAYMVSLTASDSH